MLLGHTSMSNPLPDSTISALQTCKTAALAAALIVAGSFPEILAFAAKVSVRPGGVKASNDVLTEYEPPKRAGRRPKRGDGRVREAPDQCDERLMKTMKANPGANIASLAEAIGKSRTSTVNALRRLRDAGLAESRDRVWTLTEPAAPKETPRWTAPVSAQRRRVEAEEREHA
jgi:hypothetical protein